MRARALLLLSGFLSVAVAIGPAMLATGAKATEVSPCDAQAYKTQVIQIGRDNAEALLAQMMMRLRETEQRIQALEAEVQTLRQDQGKGTP